MTSRIGAALVVALVLSGFGTAPAGASQPRIEARSWALIDAGTGDVLASHAAARRLPIASTTKLMTAYVVLHELPLRRIVRAARYRPTYGESVLGLHRGQRISVRDLLYGLILRSGNDAAYDLALAAAGSEARFVRQMNLRAADLGLADTHYANPIGLDQRGNHSSARDLTTLARRLLRIPVFARIANSRSAVLRSLRPKRRISTINELLLRAPWVNGVKTGHTFGARFVLVASGRRKGVELISAVIGAPTDADRFADNLRLLDYGFSRYRRRVPVRAGREVALPPIRWSGGTLPLLASRNVAIDVRRGQRLTLTVRAPREVAGPIHRGAILGRVVVFVAGLPVADVPLRAARSIPRASTLDRVRGFIGENPIPASLAGFVILIGAALLPWRLRRRGTKERDEIQVSREETQPVSDQSDGEGVPE